MAEKNSPEEEHVKQGEAHNQEGNREAAISEFKKALIINPDSAPAHCNLGDTYYLQGGKLDEAIAEYKAAINIDPNYGFLRHNFGVAYQDQGKLDEAIAEYKAAIKIRPNHVPGHYGLAQAYSLKNERGRAIESLQRAITLDKGLIEKAKTHKAFDNIRGSSGFQKLINPSAQNQLAQKKPLLKRLFGRTECPICSKPVEKNERKCRTCGVRFLLKPVKTTTKEWRPRAGEFTQIKTYKFVWANRQPEPEEPASCPQCSSPLWHDTSISEGKYLYGRPKIDSLVFTSECRVCGIGITWSGDWRRRIPMIADGCHLKSKSFSERLKKCNLSTKKYLELFSQWESGLIAPVRFFNDVLRISEDDFSGVKYKPLDMLISSLLRGYALPTNPSEASELQPAIKASFRRRYDHYFIDFCVGGGWLPAYEAYTPISPSLRWVKPENGRSKWWSYGICRGKNAVFALEYDARIDQLGKDNKLASDEDSETLCCFRLALSDKDDINASQMEHFWTSLQGMRHPVVFEIVGSGRDHQICFQFLCHPDDKERIAHQLIALFPNSLINPNGDDEDYLVRQIGSDYQEKFLQDFHGHGVSFGLVRHYAYQLRHVTRFDKTDSLYSLINSLAELAGNEGAVIQVLISPLKGWNEYLSQIEVLDEIVGYVSQETKDDLRYENCPLDKKRRFPLFAVCFRAMAFGKKGESPHEKIQSFPAAIETALGAMKLPESNCLSSQPLELVEGNRTGYSPVPKSFNPVDSTLSEKELLSVWERKSYRHGFILNSQELASLCHFPSKALEHPKLLRQDSMFAKAPEHLTQGKGLLIGINEVFGERKEVYIPEDFRFRHMYTVGKTGTGKTTFLFNLLRLDIEAGKGVGLIDPHGDLVEQVLRIIPENRIDDVILFDPADYEYPIGFNMMQVTNAQERRQMRGDILVAIRRMFEDASWGDNIDQLFRACIATLLADTRQAHTLLDIRRLLSDEVFRSQVLKRIDDDFLEEFWRDDYPNFAKTTVSAVRRRLASIFNEPEVRNVLAQPKTSFNFKEMMDTKKIFLAKISRGTLGEDISRLFGGLLVSKLQLTAMARESQPESERVPFYLYVDEFQNFVNEGFEIILSEARKYKLSLTMAHQFTAQLPRGLYNAVFGNVGTLIAFETGVEDAMALERQLGKFSTEDIINLESFTTITRIGKAKEAFSMKTLPPPEMAHDVSQQVRALSRAKYCRKPESVQASESEPETSDTAREESAGESSETVTALQQEIEQLKQQIAMMGQQAAEPKGESTSEVAVDESEEETPKVVAQKPDKKEKEEIDFFE